MKTRRKKERGVAMLIALLSLVLLAIIGLGFMFMADTENSVNNNYKDAQKAYFASRAGLENIRLLMTAPNPVTLAGGGPLYNQVSALTMPNAAANTGVIYVTNPTGGADVIDPADGAGNTPTLNPTLDDELCHEQFPLLALTNSGAGAPCLGTAGNQVMRAGQNYYQLPNPALPAGALVNAGTASALPFKWVRITNKQNFMGLTGQSVDGAQVPGNQVCWTGSQEVVTAPGACAASNANPVWMLTSLAVTPGTGNSAGSRRFTQMEVAFSPAILPPAPISTKAPVTLQGSFQLNAYDQCSCNCTTDKSGNSVCTATQPGIACDGTHHAVFTENSVTQLGGSGSTITSFGNDPTKTPVSIMNVPDSQWPYDINGLINNLAPTAQRPSWSSSCTGTANFTSIPPSYLSCGTQSSQTFGGFPSGMLQNPPVEPTVPPNTVTEYIPGSVHLTSGASGSGILIIDGDLDINGGLNWYGLILVRGSVTFTGGAGSSVNLFGSILAGQDVTAVNQGQLSVDGDKFGGSINFHYDVCALKNGNGNQPPHMLATHEMSY
ncbi:MAG TPA: hypothetical protein VJN64_15305 [Terriglobales bacterium]|nr:hypothetical protein [Terriglobales bacterium]